MSVIRQSARVLFRYPLTASFVRPVFWLRLLHLLTILSMMLSPAAMLPLRLRSFGGNFDRRANLSSAIPSRSQRVTTQHSLSFSVTLNGVKGLCRVGRRFLASLEMTGE